MKTILIALLYIAMHAEFNSAQIPGDYPFKTVVDNDGFLYVTGKDSNNNLLVRKYPPIENSAYVWTQSYTNSNGNDRGMNIILDTDGNAYVVGFMKNTNTGKTNATIAKLEGSDGQFIWFKIIDSMSESKVFGLTTDGSYLYAAGYYKNRLGGKDYLVVKYDLFGNRQWLRTFDNPAYHGDDVATDILVDEGYIYLMGYTYNGVSSGTDIMMVTYTKDGVMPTSQIYQKKGNEYPTGFLFTYKSDDWRAKSRTSSVGFTDNMNEHNTKDIITIAFNNDFNTSVRWVKIFDNPDTSIYSNDVATDIAVKNPYSPNQVFITGYTQTGTKGYDFVTISYDAFNGNTNWIHYYDYPSTTSGDDKSSSMLVRNDSLIISGSCEKSPNGYKTIKYALSGNNPPEQELWSNTFIPSFQIGRPVNSFGSASILHLSGEGNITTFFMGWNETFQNFAAQMYDANGNIVYTLDPDVSNSISFRGYKNNNAETNYSKDYSAIILGQNYPNPFNPETEISYELQAAGYIRVGVYNLLGEEVSVLAEGKFAPGRYKVRFNGSNLASGVYFYELKANGMRKDMKRMILVK